MKRNLAYLYYVVMHKYYIIVAGRKLGLPIWQLLAHDWSKFTPTEWPHYARTFYDENGKSQYKPDHQYQIAWFMHRHRHPHHWQFWVEVTNDNIRDGFYISIPVAMTDRYILEMVADWAASSKIKTGSWDVWSWALENIPNMRIHHETLAKVWATITKLREELK